MLSRWPAGRARCPWASTAVRLRRRLGADLRGSEPKRGLCGLRGAPEAQQQGVEVHGMQSIATPDVPSGQAGCCSSRPWRRRG